VNVFVPSSEAEENLNYFVALLNSRLLWFWFSHYAKRRGVALEINGNVLSRAPIKRINFKSTAERRIHDTIAELAALMQELTSKLEAAVTDRDHSVNQNRLAAMDKELDVQVYKLYGLDASQIAQIERELPN